MAEKGFSAQESDERLLRELFSRGNVILTVSYDKKTGTITEITAGLQVKYTRRRGIE